MSAAPSWIRLLPKGVIAAQASDVPTRIVFWVLMIDCGCFREVVYYDIKSSYPTT